MLVGLHTTWSAPPSQKS